MPSFPSRKGGAKSRPKGGVSRNVDDSDTDSSMPPLVDNSESDDESKQELCRPRKALSNAESVEIWLDLSKATRSRHIHVMKIYLLSPLLFDSVEQEDKWINWAQECHLLPTKKNCELCMDTVNIVEDAFDNVNKHLLAKADSDLIEKALGMMDKINALGKLDKAIMCAESFTTFLKIRENIKTVALRKKGDSKRKGDTALLLALLQMYDHIKKLTRDNKDLTKQYEETLKQGDLQSNDLKEKGNHHFMEGKYKAAISAYNKAVFMAQYSHILYGNRAQSYLRTGEIWQALADGRRSVVLKPDWTKGQYRYAQAYFDLGEVEQAITTNRDASAICQDTRILDGQYDKFLKEKDIQVGKAAAKKELIQNDQSKIDDLPQLVDAGSTDTSGDSSDDDDDDDDDDDYDDCGDYNDEDEDLTVDGDGESENELSPYVPVHVPELVTDSSKESDSDDSTSQRRNTQKRWKKDMKKAQVNQTIKKKRKDKQNLEQGRRKELEPSEGFQKRRELNASLRLGTKALLDSKFRASVRFYGEVFVMLSVEDAFEIFKIKHIDYILILYAHGTACLETSIHKELLDATQKFNTIIIQYKDIKFPLAFYGLGRVYHRQNRFSEALEPLNRGFNMVNTREEFGEYRWPGTQTIIEETRPGKLKKAFESMIAECTHPPRPDAICRFTDCNGRTEIYLTDTDYKGIVRLICDEECKVDYHPSCWKKFKSTYGNKNADKDYLEDGCMTPDCEAIIACIQIYAAEASGGLKTEFTTDCKRNKQKQAKQGKIKTHGNQKPLKAEKPKKEEKDIKPDQAVRDIKDGDTKKEDVEYANPSPKPANRHVEVLEEKEIVQSPERKKAPKEPRDPGHNLNRVDHGVYILRKNEEQLQDEMGFARGAKGKGKKKKPKNIQSLDEFLKDRGGEAFKTPFPPVGEEEGKTEIPLMIPPHEWSQHELNAPFAVPSHLQSDVQAFEREYRTGVDPAPRQPIAAQKDTSPAAKAIPSTDTIEDYILSLVKETLSAHGPLDVADARIIEPITFLPESHQQKIEACGGIRSFLMKSEQFVVQGNVVMLPDEAHFQQIVKNVSRYLNGAKTHMNNGSHGNEQFDAFSRANSLISPTPRVPRRTNAVIPADESLSSSSSESVVLETPLSDATLKAMPLPSSRGAAMTTTSPTDIPPAHNTHASEQLLNLLSNMAANVSPERKDAREVDGKSDPLKHDVGKMLSKFDLFTVPEKSGTLCSALPQAQTKTIDTNTPLWGLTAGEDHSRVSPVDTATDNDPMTPSKHIRAGSAGLETVGYKSKGVQTQQQVKAKGVMTDALPEPFKVDFLRVSQEKEDSQRKLQEATEKLTNIQGKHGQDLDKIRTKYSDILIEKEKLAKELQSVKQEGKSELNKVNQLREEKLKLATSLEQRFKLEENRYQITITGLKAELAAAELLLEKEKAKFATTIAHKDDLIMKTNVLRQLQEARAQEAEIKLLELRRDVGLRFLERAFQEAHLTLNNLVVARKTRNTSIMPKLDELINTWKAYGTDCHKKIVQCKASFDGLIQELRNGRVLSSLPPLPIPGPLPFPAPPILQPLNTQIQIQNPPQPPTENHGPAYTGQPVQTMTATAPQPRAPAPISIAPQHAQRLPPQQKGPIVPPQTMQAPPVPQMAPQGSPEGTPSGGAKSDGDKGRPTNSFERIMLRLSTTYPFFARAELTSLIKEVRQNKRGTLTGLSLEEIVKSVSDLVEAKVKAGMIRLPSGQPSTGNQRIPTTQPGPQQTTTNPHGVGMNGATNNYLSPPSAANKLLCGDFELDDDDPCVICHDDMRSPIDAVTLECGHKYHNKCIRKWLMGEQSTCPTCRVHALLPDEFPRLK